MRNRVGAGSETISRLFFFFLSLRACVKLLLLLQSCIRTETAALRASVRAKVAARERSEGDDEDEE